MLTVGDKAGLDNPGHPSWDRALSLSHNPSPRATASVHGPADNQGQPPLFPMTLWLVTSVPVWAKVSDIRF